MSLCSVKMSSFILGSLKTPWSVMTSRSLASLVSTSRASPAAGLVDQPVQVGDLLAQGGRIDRGDDPLQLVEDLLLLFVGQVVEVFGQAACRSAPGGSLRGRPGSSAACRACAPGCGATA